VEDAMRGKLFLIHWNPPEAEHLARDLRAANWRVDFETEDRARAQRRIRERPPDAVVISLARSPVDGLEVACALRGGKSASAPIVFLDGTEDAVKAAKARVPAALFTTSGELADMLIAYAQAGWG
jgi:DNA-binding response OmpR family regulator